MIKHVIPIGDNLPIDIVTWKNDRYPTHFGQQMLEEL